MFRYELAEPNYRPFPYETSLAWHELSALAGGAPASNGAVETELQIEADQLRRLAFSSRVITGGTEIATDVARLELATRELRDRRGSKKESNYLTHGLHRFHGKFYPQLARALINRARLAPGDLMLDPFCGSGTALVESWLLGVDAVGFDVNPLATLIARTKVALLEVPGQSLSAGLDLFEDRLVREAKREGLSWAGLGDEEPSGREDYDADELATACGVPAAQGELDRWFPGSVRHKLTIVLRVLETIDDPVTRDFLRVCLSDQVRSSSQQEPRDLRTRRRHEPIEDAPLLSALLTKARAEVNKLRVGQELTKDYPWQAPRVLVELRDTRKFSVSGHSVLAHRAVDAVVTSPPYATALPYVDTERLSFIVLGLMSKRQRMKLEREMIGSREVADVERRRIESEMEQNGLAELPTELRQDLRDIMETNRRHAVGFRRRNTAALLYQYFVGMKASLSKIAQAMRPGGEAYLVLGNSKTLLGDGRTFSIVTCDHIARLAEQVGFSKEESVPITVTTQNLAHAKNAITANQVLVLRRC